MPVDMDGIESSIAESPDLDMYNEIILKTIYYYIHRQRPPDTSTLTNSSTTSCVLI